MKKYRLMLCAFGLCFVFSITLFSNESEEPKEKKDEKTLIEKDEKQKTKDDENGKKKRIAKNSDEKVEVSDVDATIKDSDEKIKSKREENVKGVKPATDKAEKQEVDASLQKTKSNQEAKKKEKADTEAPEFSVFSSIQVNGLTIGNGSRWYFEEYDEEGNVVSSASYDRRKMIEESSIEYSEGKKVAAVFKDMKMIVKVKYNNKGVEVEREEFESNRGEIGKMLNSSKGVYDEAGNLLEETKVENGVTKRYVYTYNKKEKATETVYEDDKQVLFVEYGEGSKTVHVFNEGEEVAVFNEDVE